MISSRLYFLTILIPFTQMVFSNTLSLTGDGDDTWNVNYISDATIAGFQFQVDGAVVNSASGGDAAENGFMISSSSSSNTVLGFSLTESTIPPGAGILVAMELAGTPTGLSGIIVSDPNGIAIDFTYDDGSGCMDDTACNYDLDATQDDESCEYAEDNYDCDGNCIVELDECGICAGDGSSCAVIMVDVLYNSDTDIAGFQFYVENVVLISTSGGDAESFGFMVSTGNNIVLGFSLTGSVIPAGSGVLTTLEVEGTGACINDLIFSDTNGNALAATIDDCFNIYYTTPIPGCTDDMACNYNSDAETDDGSCQYPEENYDCDGNCVAELDCMGDCGGSAELDECEVCNGPGIPDGECDCEGNVEDCAGVCNGDAVLDECGVCDGDGTSCLFVTLYFGSLTENNIEIWLDNPLGVAGFQFMLSGLSISGASGGSSEENGFMVSNSATTVVGFSLSGALIPVGNALLINLSFDGISGEDICLSGAVIADQNGNGIDYEVGFCLDPENYFNGGCSDDSACNYVVNTDYDDGSCVYAQENFDCDGNCLLEYDCAGVCGGNSIVDECGVCGGTGPEENYNCDGNCIVNIDCNGECGGGVVYDNCGTCGGDGSNCENPEAALSFGDLEGDVMLGISYIDPIGDICIQNPILSDPVGNAVSVIVGGCVALTETPGVLEMYLNSSIDIAGFQFNLTGLTITGASGGSAEANGFMISSSASTVVGFSLTGSTMDANGSVGCMDDSACNYDGEATISSGCSYEVDCAGICGGSAEVDECGLCNGPGADIECWDGELVCNAENCTEEPEFTDVDYLTEIQPIFNANCTYYCHTNGGSYQGGLDLTSYDNLMAGDSDHGPIIIPGDSENSILIQKLSDEPPFGDQMPQNGPPYLDAVTIAHIAAWIDAGALPSEDGNGDDGGEDNIEGCTDPNAENFNPEATIDDGSCTYAPLGELTFGTIDYDAGTLEINLDCEYDVSSFVFDLTGVNPTGYYGGTSEAAGFDISIDGITVSGNSTGDNVPANSGLLMIVTFDAVTEDEICFASSTITTFIGIEYEAILDDCILVDGGNYIELSIELNEGANLISFSVLPEDNTVGNVLSPLGDNAVGLSGEGEAALNTENGWIGSLITILYENGYWLLVDETAILNLTGISIQSDQLYALHAGNNLISYPLSECGNIDEVIPDEIEGCLYAIAGEGVATLNTDAGWVGSLTILCPNEGYWFVNQCDDIEFSFDEPTSLARSVSLKESPYPYHQSSQQAFYFIQSIENIKVGDWILVYNGDKVIGARQWQGAIVDVPAMGNDGSDITKGYMEEDSTPQFKLLKNDELINLRGEVPAWSNNQLYIISNLTESIAIPEAFSLNRAYPNPFNPTTTVSFAIPIDSKVYLLVYNLQGREVVSLINRNMEAGYHSIVWDANSYASGVYFVKMIAGEYVNTQKLMLVK